MAGGAALNICKLHASVRHHNQLRRVLSDASLLLTITASH